MPDKFTEYLLALGLDALAPVRCALCGMDCPGEPGLCQACTAGLAPNNAACPRCALPLEAAETMENPAHPCGQCQSQQPLFRRAVVPLLYQAPTSLLLHRFKFGGATSLVKPLAALMAPAILKTIGEESAPDLLVPMPLHWWRRWRRGFNQAEMLAQELARLARHAGLPLTLDCRNCSRPQWTKPQVGLSRREREANLSTAFRCKPLADNPWVVIIDDIVTTGASANALARALLDAGASRVDLWACARTPA